MNCDQFRESILEGLAGELPAEIQPDFERHESTCAACRAELGRWREVETALRSGWPMEDPPPLPVLSLRRPQAAWWEVGWRWFSMASAALVTASLVALVVLRPSIQWDGGRLGMAFHGQALAEQMAGAQPVTQQQVQSWVRAEVQQTLADQNANGAVPSSAQASASNAPASQQWGQLRSKVELLDESQAYLWRQLQEQQVNLQSLWRTTSMQVKPPSPEHPGAE